MNLEEEVLQVFHNEVYINDIPTLSDYAIIADYHEAFIKVIEKRIDVLIQKKISLSHIHFGEQITNFELEKIIDTLDEVKELLK